MKGLRRFLKLSAAERSVFFRAIPLVAGVRLCLWVLPFRTLHERWALVLPRIASSGQRTRLTPERIVWLVAAASRFVPMAHCLTRAFAAQLLLARQGQLAKMHIGVRKQGASLDAHAWLEYEGVPLFESDAHLSGFTPFAPQIASPRNTAHPSK